MSNHGIMLTSVTAKGQATIPKPVRSLLGIKGGQDHIGFRIRNGKVELVPVKVEEKESKFTKQEWKKIEKLANQKGKVFHSAKEAIKYVDSL